jgi:thiosulfate dehydrogenase [quinone] large subunit
VRTAAAVRILTGVMLIALGWGKVAGDFVKTGFAEETKAIAAEAWPFWRSFLESVVLPGSGTFAWLFALGEIAVGIGLVLGLFTRAAAAGGALLMLTILLGTGRGEPGATWDKWVTAGMTAKFTLLLLLLLFAADAGKVWGLDGVLQKKKRAPKAR